MGRGGGGARTRESPGRAVQADFNVGETCWVGNSKCVNDHGITANDLGVWDCMLSIGGQVRAPGSRAAGARAVTQSVSRSNTASHDGVY